jgi:hypothetical protein
MGKEARAWARSPSPLDASSNLKGLFFFSPYEVCFDHVSRHGMSKALLISIPSTTGARIFDNEKAL